MGDQNLLKQVESCAQDYPFNAILIAFAKSLPHRLLFGGFPSDTDPGSPASRSICRRWILLDLSKFNPLGWDVVSRISEIEHTPKRRIGVGFGYLEQGKIWRIRRRQGEFVDRRKDTSISDGPLEVSGCFAADDF